MPNNPTSTFPADIEAGLQELETHRTIGLTRMQVGDPVVEQPMQEETAPEDVAKYEISIPSMSNGLDGGQGVLEGEVEIVEYLNDEYVSSVKVKTSAIVEAETPLGLIEDRLLNSTHEAIRRIADLSQAELRSSLDQTKKDQDQAYQA